MTAVVYKLRDYQNPKDIERMQRELEKEAAKILEGVGGSVEMVPYHGAGIDGMDLPDPA
jgi:hypothetical protein